MMRTAALLCFFLCCSEPVKAFEDNDWPPFNLCERAALIAREQLVPHSTDYIKSNGSQGILSFRNGYGARSREIEIPNVVTAARMRKMQAFHDKLPLRFKVIVVAGNTHYDGTRHNLGFEVGDRFLRRTDLARFLGPVPYPGVEIKISYDDESIRNQKIDFYSVPGWERTSTGEVFKLPSAPGAQTEVFVVKGLGDYNELGDFAGPIIHLLGVEAKDILVVHDDLTTPSGTSEIVWGDVATPVRPEGNGFLKSMNRNLLIGLDDYLVARLAERENLRTLWDSVQSVYPFKFFEDALEARPRDRIEGIRTVGFLETFFANNPRMRLPAELDKPELKEVQALVVAEARRRLAYNDLRIGIEAPGATGADTVVDYVLGFYSGFEYDDSFFDSCIAQISEFIKR